MKLKRSGLATKIVILALIIYAGASLFSSVQQIRTELQKNAEQQERVDDMYQENSELQYDIDHSTDPEIIEGVVRNNIGLVKPGEIIFYDVGD